MTDRQEQIRDIASAADEAELKAMRARLFDPPAEDDEPTATPRTNRVLGEGSNPGITPGDDDGLRAFAAELFDR